jgi:DNA polymerase III subunit delta'
MSFRDFPTREQGVQLLQRSLARGRLAHGYLFTGDPLDELEGLAKTLAKTLSCLQPSGKPGAPTDCCDACLNCRKIENGNHADVHWVRPESKSRVIVIEQMRELMHEINLKPTEAGYKVGIIVAADRLNDKAANAFLKTLEEPPPKSVLILLTTEPQRMLETIVSRCLRLNFSGDATAPLDPAQQLWLTRFSDVAAAEQKSLISRYRLMDVLLQKLAEMKAAIDASLTARSPLQRYDDIEKDLRDKWEDELAAAIEAEYRRQRADLLRLVQRWLRDIWLHTLAAETGRLHFPDLTGAAQVARRITPAEAIDNLQVVEATQRLLHTNVQEALALEVGLLKLHL